MINKKKLFIIMTAALAIIFSITYYLSDKYITNKIAQNESTQEVSKNNSNDNSKDKNGTLLDESLKVYLFAGDKKEQEVTVADLKKEFNIDEDLTQAELTKVLRDKGYALAVTSNNELTYKRDPSQAVKPNKYYIGEKDGYLAIYKTDENGTLMIENEEDVYSDNKKVDTLKELDINKIRNFEFEYDSKEQAEEDLSEFLS